MFRMMKRLAIIIGLVLLFHHAVECSIRERNHSGCDRLRLNPGRFCAAIAAAREGATRHFCWNHPIMSAR